MNRGKVLRHAANTQKGALDVCHFLFVQCGQRPISKALAIQRARLIHDHLPIHQQAAFGTNRYPPNPIVGIHLRCDRQNDMHMGC